MADKAIFSEETKKMLRSTVKESMNNKEQEYLQTGNLGFDLALTDGKGIPIGGSILLWSTPGVGKTTVVGDICKRLLLQTEGSEEPFRIMYIDTEGSKELLYHLGLKEFMDSKKIAP